MTNEEFIESIRLQGEEWRDVVGWEGFYVVSSFGRIASLKRTVTQKCGKRYSVKPSILKPNTTKHNGIYYNYICFRRNRERFVVAIHRLVAKAFIPNPNGYTEVDHADRNGLNNMVSNLSWCDRQINMNNPNTRKLMLESQRARRRRELLSKQNVKERLPDASGD